jgi:PEGA domain
VLIAAAGVARGADSAEQLLHQGIEARKRGDDLGALPLFEQAYKQAPTPRAAAQRGFCEQALGRWANAEAHLEEALKSPDDPWVKKNRAEIQASLTAAKANVATIEIKGEPPGGEVLVNGAVVGRFPLEGPMRVDAGEIDVEVRSPGYQRASRTLHVSGGQYQQVVVRAEREAPAGASASGSAANLGVAPPPADSCSATGSKASPDTTTSQTEGASTGRLAAKWVAWGVGAAAVGVGIYGGVHHEDLVGQFNQHCAIDNGMVYLRSGPQTLAGCQDLKASYDNATTLEIVGYAAAGALAVGGLILFLTEPASASPASQTALRCAPGVGSRAPLSVSCALRF